ncbi:N-6 DNA methylase [Streptomyces albidoflavus]|uniref:N-6 DNA methylase n=1 Tax=Streptomyces albidoflavus TaxID=1886 RepID=UPI0008F4CC25|nr:N-6 DNA methylase [Streptomyces albidoflavus]
MNDLGRLLVSRADIARLAGVKRPAVTNWERRHEDFPGPAGPSGRAGADVFRADEVAAWLSRRTVPANARQEGELAGTTFGDRFRAGLDRGGFSAQEFVHRLLAESNRFRGDLSPADHMLLLLAMVYTWGVSPEARGSASSLYSVMRRVLERDIRAYDQITTLAEVFGRQGPGSRAECAAVFDLLVDRYRNEYGRREGGELFTPRSLARTMARMLSVAAPSPRSIHDPFCRAGEVLAAALAEVPGSEDGPLVAGETPSRDALRLTTMNLALHGAEDEVVLQGMAIGPGGEHRWRGGGFDWVVTNPPFALRLSPFEGERVWRYGHPGFRGDFAWLQHVLDQLASGGRAAVVMPEGAGFISGRAQQIREEMVEDGAVECVVALPSQLFANTAIPVNLWILTPPSGRCDEVFFIDGSGLGRMSGPAQRELTEADTSAVVDAYIALRRGETMTGPAQPGAVAGRAVGIDELRERQYRLTPRSSTVPEISLNDAQASEQSIARRMEEMASVEARLQGLSGDLERSGKPWQGTWLRTPTSGSGTTPRSGWEERPLGEVAELTAGPGGRTRDTGDAAGVGVPMVRPAAMRGHRILHEEVTWVPLDEVDSLARYRLRPGDVVMTRTGTPGRCALVTETEEGWLFGSHLVRIRPAVELLHSSYLLGLLERPQAQSWISRRASGTTVRSLSLKELHHLPVLLPPLAEQRHIGRRLNSLDEQRRTLTELVAALDVYRAELADLLVSGWVSLPVAE